MTAPWRISEVLRLHVDAKHEDVDDTGVISYGLRYYGAKGFAHDIKWVSRTMEPVAREAFRRIRELTESARALPKHLKTTPDTPFLYHDRPQVGLHHELTVTQKAAYLRRKVLKGRGGVPPKLIIFNGFLVGAGAQHCQGQIRQRDRFATTMTIPTRNGDFGATRAGSKWPAPRAHSTACPNA